MKKTALKTIFVLALILLFSCKNSSEKTAIRTETNMVPAEDLTDQTQAIKYFEFTPESILKPALNEFDIDYAYQIGANKIIVGYDQSVIPAIDQDWGDKLLLLNDQNEILFKSAGVGDVYLFEPHFYKNDQTDKVIIICQLGFEYFFGGEAFLFDKGEVSAIGTLDIEGDNEEKSLTDIVEITEIGDAIEFSFKSDNLYLAPGAESVLIKNSGVRYVYKNTELKLEK